VLQQLPAIYTCFVLFTCSACINCGAHVCTARALVHAPWLPTIQPAAAEWCTGMLWAVMMAHVWPPYGDCNACLQSSFLKEDTG
jgi:hypothetical protein